jgi:hypothetical protein
MNYFIHAATHTTEWDDKTQTFRRGINWFFLHNQVLALVGFRIEIQRFDAAMRLVLVRGKAKTPLIVFREWLRFGGGGHHGHICTPKRPCSVPTPCPRNVTASCTNAKVDQHVTLRQGKK